MIIRKKYYKQAEKSQVPKRSEARDKSDYLRENIQSRTKWMNNFEMLKENKC